MGSAYKYMLFVDFKNLSYCIQYYILLFLIDVWKIISHF